MSRFQSVSFLASAISLASLSIVANAQARLRDKDVVSTRLQQSGENVAHLSQIANCDQNGRAYQDAAVTITTLGPTLTFQGTDLTGGSWNAKLRITGLGCTIFKGDIDNNGEPDLVVYSPGIGDRGSYGTSLTILLFDKTGKPFPWQATGRFTLVNGGIQEIKQDSKGVAIIQTSELGLAAWGGVSFVSYIYRFSDGRVTASHETFEGIEFPHLIAANQNDSRTTHTASAIDLSTDVVARGAVSPVRSTDAKLVRYGMESGSSTLAAKTSSVAAGPIANPTIDLNALSSTGNQIVASDGSKFELPDILVIDDAAGSRQIVFHPEDSDFKQMTDKKYQIHPTGLNCSDPDGCRPFIVWAK
jgi:hypothetical protein